MTTEIDACPTCGRRLVRVPEVVSDIVAMACPAATCGFRRAVHISVILRELGAPRLFEGEA